MLSRKVVLLNWFVLGLVASARAQDSLVPPNTVDEAVAVLRHRWLRPQDEDLLLRMPEGLAVARLHVPFGTAVRNAFQLWGSNDALRRSCGTEDPEGCSGIIFEHLWKAIRSSADTQLVHQLDCQFDLMDRVRIRYRGFSALKMGAIIDSLSKQIDKQVASLRDSLPAGCTAQLGLRLVGNPNLQCWARVEFSEDGHDPVPLSSFFGWFDWRNAFDAVNVPPYVELRFRDPCAWSHRPTEFGRGG